MTRKDIPTKEDVALAEVARRRHVTSQLIKLVHHGFTCAVCVLVSYFGFTSLSEFAGKTTVVNSLVKWLVDMRVNEWLGTVLGGAGIAYGLRERKMRRRNNRTVGTRNVELEKQLDEERTSSNLLPEGTTRKEDEQ